MNKKIISWFITGCMAFQFMAFQGAGIERVYAAEASASEKTVSEKTASENAVSAEAASSAVDIDALYYDVLYQYKLILDREYSVEQIEDMGLWTSLTEQGWPSSSKKKDVRYLFYDVDENGTDELIITCDNEIADIYGYDGFKVRYVYGNYADKVSLYPGGMLKEEVSYQESGDCESWYQFDTGMGDFFPVIEMYSYEEGENEYYTFGFDESVRDEIESSYREFGQYPVWTYEWADMLTEKEYKALCPKEEVVKLPKGISISDIELPCPLNTDKEIRSFLAGEWTLINPENGKDGGVLEIEKDGSFTYTRRSDNRSGNGTLSFEHVFSDRNQEPDFFSLEFEDMEELVPEGMEIGEYSATDTSGLFHIGSDGDKDYLYLAEMGNGDTLVSAYAFNENKDLEDYESWYREWVFYRDDSDLEAAPPKNNSSFYAWSWKKDKDSVWLQEMDLTTYETYGEYDDRAFLGGFFSESSDVGIACYEFADEAEKYGMFYEQEWEHGTPLYMYRVDTDSEGRIKNIEELDHSLYGVYDMGYVKPEFSVSEDGKTFYYNNGEYELKDFCPGATAIMDAKLAGGWIVLDCHVNPHYGIYEFFNMDRGDFVYEIMGANLTWQDNDLSTAVYSMDDAIYDIWGNQIAYVEDDGAEIYELSYLNFRTLFITYMITEDGKEEECEAMFEYLPQDKAVFAYYEYLLSGAPSKWRAFISEAPEEGAEAFIMVDPPEAVLDLIDPSLVPYEKNAPDKLAVVSLKKDLKILVGPAGSGTGGKNKNNTGNALEPFMGEMVVYGMTVPAGKPKDTLFVMSKDSDGVVWDITRLSGEEIKIGEFLPEEEQVR
ncbi:MAG: hypothetical protein K5770_00880 [Lachnospiraceae bacterium]|nr:hypothetical protein [Lachnospiraceae bacterium]